MEEEWRIPLLNELISAKNNKIVIDGIDQAELDDIINFIRKGVGSYPTAVTMLHMKGTTQRGVSIF